MDVPSLGGLKAGYIWQTLWYTFLKSFFISSQANIYVFISWYYIFSLVKIYFQHYPEEAT